MRRNVLGITGLFIVTSIASMLNGCSLGVGTGSVDVAKQIMTENITAEVTMKETTEEITTEEMTTEEMTTEEMTTEEMTTEEMTAEETTTEEMTTEESTTEEMTTDEPTTEEITTEETTTEEPATEETKEPAVAETVEETTVTLTENSRVTLEVNCILQMPDLPTGCEITSLTIVLNHKGVPADKCDLADNYLEKGAVGTVLPMNSFVGNPRDNNSFGCYSPVIVKTANRYLAAMGSDLTAVDLSGSSFESLFAEIEAGNPIVIWATLNMDEPYYSVTWNVNGEKFTWKRREHCLVLTGYDVDAGLVYVADPMKGNVTYDMKVFKDRYEKMYSQAVVIK